MDESPQVGGAAICDPEYRRTNTHSGAAGAASRPDGPPPPTWPYGPPGFHEDCCLLHEGGAYCDCKASDASDTEWGMAF